MLRPLTHRALRGLAVATLALAVTAGPASAASGDLDTSFGTAGRVVVPTPSGTSTIADTHTLSNGNVVAVGTRGAVGARNVFVARFTPDGALDTTFGVGGVASIDAGSTADVGVTIIPRTAGGYWVGGKGDSVGDNGFVAAIDNNGTLVPAFGPGGIAYIGGGGSAGTVVEGLTEDGAGGIVYVSLDETQPGTGALVGGFDPTGAGLNAGTITATFSDDPVGIFRIAGGNYIVVGTQFDPAGPANRIATTRLDPTFAVDATYTPSGSTLLAADGGTDELSEARLLPGDALLLLGARGATPTATKQGAVFRITAAGAFDSSFGTGGRLTFPVASESWTITGQVSLADGSQYLTGDLGTNRVRTLKASAAYVPDASFASNGYADRQYDTPSRAADITVDTAARPIVFGTLGTTAAAYRIERFYYAATHPGAIAISPDFIQRLSTVTFTFTVKNDGPDASGVTVDIDIPASVEGQTYSSSNGGTVVPVADGTGATWTVPSLAAGQGATLTVTGKPGDVGTLTVASSVTAQTSVRVGAAATIETKSVTVFGAATPRDDVIQGTPGNDSIDALGGNDIVFGLAGNDRLLGNSGNDKLDGGAGNDSLLGGTGNDQLLGQAGNDSLNGGEGTDRLDGGTGNDRALGGAGNDVILGGLGNDKLYGESGDDLVRGGAGNDYVHGGPGVDRLYGDTGDDYLVALYGPDLLIAGPGNDLLDGDGGGDRLYGGTGNDGINGKSGNDLIDGSTGNDWLRGQVGNDRINGGSGRDLLNGGAGTDRLIAGSGFDIVRADDGRGGDVVDCGSGWDLVYANRGDIVASNCEYVKYDVPNGTPV